MSNELKLKMDNCLTNSKCSRRPLQSRLLNRCLKQDPLKKLKRKRGLQSKEYDNLRQLLPSLAYVKDVSKVDVVYEAAKYIDKLHQKLIMKLKSGQLGNKLTSEQIISLSNPSNIESLHQFVTSYPLHHSS